MDDVPGPARHLAPDPRRQAPVAVRRPGADGADQDAVAAPPPAARGPPGSVQSTSTVGAGGGEAAAHFHHVALDAALGEGAARGHHQHPRLGVAGLPPPSARGAGSAAAAAGPPRGSRAVVETRPTTSIAARAPPAGIAAEGVADAAQEAERQGAADVGALRVQPRLAADQAGQHRLRASLAAAARGEVARACPARRGTKWSTAASRVVEDLPLRPALADADAEVGLLAAGRGSCRPGPARGGSRRPRRGRRGGRTCWRRPGCGPAPARAACRSGCSRRPSRTRPGTRAACPPPRRGGWRRRPRARRGRA